MDGSILVVGLPVDAALTEALRERSYKAVLPHEFASVLADGDHSLVIVNHLGADDWSGITAQVESAPAVLHFFDAVPTVDELRRVGDGHDFACDASAAELQARIDRLVGSEEVDDIVTFGALVLNTATYQATVSGRPLDLTYMEYELLKHFVLNPCRTHTRQQLLKTVWGYDYYGGARTVDVHVRRLRFKLGEEQAQLIQTVRSVGYIFGRPITADEESTQPAS